MTLNKQSGNMYPFVTHTWNPIKGKCPHDCLYCYMKRFPQKEMRLAEEEFKTHLGKDNFIFVGSSTDMFANAVSSNWIERVLNHCRMYRNKYLFQSKNPKRFEEFCFTQNTIFGTTIETNRDYKVSIAPSVEERKWWISETKVRMVSIEPIMDFDLEEFVKWIKEIDPLFVSIGADSKGHDLKEPDDVKTKMLIAGLKEFTEVKVKSNLSRILQEKR